MEHTPAFHPLDYLSVLQRRKWWLIVPSVLVVAIGVGLALSLPRTYKGTATLGVALPVISQEVSTSSQRVSVQERLRTIQQILYSTPLLERIAREEGLEARMEMPEAVNLLRNSVTPVITRPDPALPPNSLERFSISYEDATAWDAQRITNRFATAFVEESRRRSQVVAEETSAFITRELDASRARLDALEGRLADAKAVHMGALPEQTSANLAMETNAQQQLDSTVNAIRSEQDRLSSIEQRLDAMASGWTGETASTGASLAPPGASRVADIERELAQKRGTYTDSHPDIVALREKLAAARAEASATAARPQEDRVALLQQDPVYRRQIEDRDASRQRLVDLQRSEGQLRSRIAMYQTRVEAAPQVEQQMVNLRREHEVEMEQYRNLSTRLRNAHLDEQLVQNSGGEQFTILASAPLPTGPDSPDVGRLLLVTIVVGLTLGSGLAMGREYLDRSVHDARSLSDVDVPVIGEIPRIAQS